MQHPEKAIIRYPELRQKLGGVSRSTIDRWEASQSFPKRIKLGHNSIGWILAAVDQWIEYRVSNSQKCGDPS